MEVVVAIRAYCFPMRKKDECEHEHWRPAIFLFILLRLLYPPDIDVPCLPRLFYLLWYSTYRLSH